MREFNDNNKLKRMVNYYKTKEKETKKRYLLQSIVVQCNQNKYWKRVSRCYEQIVRVKMLKTRGITLDIVLLQRKQKNIINPCAKKKPSSRALKCNLPKFKRSLTNFVFMTSF